MTQTFTGQRNIDFVNTRDPKLSNTKINEANDIILDIKELGFEWLTVHNLDNHVTAKEYEIVSKHIYLVCNNFNEVLLQLRAIREGIKGYKQFMGLDKNKIGSLISNHVYENICDALDYNKGKLSQKKEQDIYDAIRRNTKNPLNQFGIASCDMDDQN